MRSATTQRGQVVFVGDFLFPEGDAAAVRTLSLGRICRDLGYSVTVVGKGPLRAEHYDEQTSRYHVEGIRYVTMNPAPGSARQRLQHPIRSLRQAVSALESLDLTDARAVIINASGSARHVPFVAAFCRRRSIPVVCEVCEWYDPRQMNYGRLDPAYALFSLVFHRVVPRLGHVIAISRLLEGHFQQQGCHVVRIPPVLDASRIAAVNRTPRGRLSLLYAGQPGRKDLIEELLVTLAALPPDERARIEFRVLGPTRQALARLLGRSARLLDELAGVVTVVGRVPRERVLAELQGAHFTVLLRPDKRYANAGFPSKVPESLAAGTPILLNLTSDLPDYLGDGSAALVVRDSSRAELTRALLGALQLTEEEHVAFRRCARLKAEEHFDYRRYLDSFGRFLAEVKPPENR